MCTWRASNRSSMSHSNSFSHPASSSRKKNGTGSDRSVERGTNRVEPVGHAGDSTDSIRRRTQVSDDPRRSCAGHRDASDTVAGVVDAAAMTASANRSASRSSGARQRSTPRSSSRSARLPLLVLTTLCERDHDGRHPCSQDVHRRVVAALADGHRRASHLGAKVGQVAHHLESVETCGLFLQPRPHRLRSERAGEDRGRQARASRASDDGRRRRSRTTGHPPFRRPRTPGLAAACPADATSIGAALPVTKPV